MTWEIVRRNLARGVRGWSGSNLFSGVTTTYPGDEAEPYARYQYGAATASGSGRFLTLTNIITLTLGMQYTFAYEVRVTQSGWEKCARVDLPRGTGVAETAAGTYMPLPPGEWTPVSITITGPPPGTDTRLVLLQYGWRRQGSPSIAQVGDMDGLVADFRRFYFAEVAP